MCFYLLTLQAIVALTSSASAKPLGECGGHPADVVFVLDVSSSIWPKHFREHVLTFVHEVVDSLNVGEGAEHTRVGAVTFSDEVWLEFHLNQYMDKERLLERVGKVSSLACCCCCCLGGGGRRGGVVGGGGSSC